MQFLITFLEGIITFISPCVLPMIPLYILYFAGGGMENRTRRTLQNALGFVLGFTVIFVVLGLFAGSVGSFLNRYQTIVNIVTGVIVAIFGLHYTGFLKIGFLNKTLKPGMDVKPTTFPAAIVFGVVFAVGWSPCTGAFLGSAMLLAANGQSWFSGMLLLLSYSVGLGIPFVLCAVLIDKLKGTFDFIKRNYRIINLICGIFLILTGILMATGVFSKLARLLA
ncbi:MAG: cytochrome c biogenesis protein CcdA [Clostridiales bacterium]|nr:cytochrome c biogenesis protein CcdA [Clostridiales bacterium]